MATLPLKQSFIRGPTNIYPDSILFSGGTHCVLQGRVVPHDRHRAPVRHRADGLLRRHRRVLHGHRQNWRQRKRQPEEVD